MVLSIGCLIALIMIGTKIPELEKVVDTPTMGLIWTSMFVLFLGMIGSLLPTIPSKRK